MADNDTSLINEIVNFLNSDRKDVLEMAAESALSACSNERNAEHFIKNKSTVPSLLRLINHPGSIGYASLACLLHLSSIENNSLITSIITHKGINRLLEIALSYKNTGKNKQNREHVHHAISLLCNITRNNKDGVIELITKESNVIKMKLMLSRFFSLDYILQDTKNNINDDMALYLQEEKEVSGEEDPYQHVSSMLQNITQFEVGCTFLTSNTTSNRIPKIIQSIFNEIHTSTNPLRRRNCAGSIKNICMDFKQIESWFTDLNFNEKYDNSIGNDCDNICYYLLYPLISSTDDYLIGGVDEDVKVLMQDFITLMNVQEQQSDINKIREIDTITRLTLVETLLILCTHGRKVRESLRSYGAYYILKNVDLQEDDEDVSNKISDCVQFLRRDEDGMPEGSSDAVALEIARERRRREKEAEEEFNDVD